MPSGLFSYSILTFIDGQQYKYLTWEKLAQVTFLPPPKKEVMFLVRSVCLSVCLSVGLLANLWMDFDEIFWRGRAWLKDQVIQFWWRSGSHFGSGSPKSEIRILRIGGGLCSLSVSHFHTVNPHLRLHQPLSNIFPHVTFDQWPWPSDDLDVIKLNWNAKYVKTYCLDSRITHTLD